MVLPEWTDERNIYVQAGIETVLKREAGVWYRKVGRCKTSTYVTLGMGEPCGECCKRVSPNWKFGRTEEGFCSYYQGGATSDTCAIGWPYGCLTGDNAGKPYCGVKWEVINGW